MALRITNILIKDISVLKQCVRFKSQRRTLGKPPGIARSLETRLQELNYKDPEIHFKVDIGFPQNKKGRKDVMQEHIEILKKNRSNAELERLSRKNELLIPLEDVKEEWQRTVGPMHIKQCAEHYGVFQDLFGDAYFFPNTKLEVDYGNSEEAVLVHRGNHLKPNQILEAPNVSFDAPQDSLWTLVMTTPDGNFTSPEAEYVHWLVGNIKGGDISTGETIFNYLQPFPLKGSGYFRYIFVLYKQDKKIDYSSLKKETERSELEERVFKTYDFYREREEVMTPAGLAFFQADWDLSVEDFFHKVLKVPHPEYCYDFPQHYHPKQEWFPLKKPFNLYLDRYRDEKEIAKEFLLKKLKKTHPFKGEEPPLKFPNAVSFKKGTPSWLKLEIKKERLGWGRVSDYK